MKLSEMVARLAEINDQATSIEADATRAGRELDESEIQIIDDLYAEAEALGPKVERARRLETIRTLASDAGGDRRTGRQTAPDARTGADPRADLPGPDTPRRVENAQSMREILPYLGAPGFFGAARHTPVGAAVAYETRGPGRIESSTDRRSLNPSWGWTSWGEYAQAVAVACGPNRQIDRRLIINQPTDPSKSAPPEDGGYAIPPDFRNFIMQAVVGEGALLGLTDNYQTFSNSVQIPKDETTPWGSQGIQAYWTAEGAKITETKVALKEQSVALHKLAALLPVTEELREDAPMLDSYLRQRTPVVMNEEVNDSLVNGDGSGKPLGILASAAAVEVPRETGQAAASFVFQNAVDMYSRLHATYLPTAVWLISQSLMPDILSMTLPVKNVAGAENVGGTAMFIAPGALPQAPQGAILGVPIIYTEACQEAGTVGDVILVDFRRYMSVTKRQGIRFDLSIHLYFDYDVSSYRFIMRVGGQNWLDSPISPRYGSETRSNIVTLGAPSV